MLASVRRNLCNQSALTRHRHWHSQLMPNILTLMPDIHSVMPDLETDHGAPGASINPSASACLSYSLESLKTNLRSCTAAHCFRSLVRTRPSLLDDPLLLYLKIPTSTLTLLDHHLLHWIVLKSRLQSRNFWCFPGSVRRRRRCPTDWQGRMWCPGTGIVIILNSRGLQKYLKAAVGECKKISEQQVGNAKISQSSRC